MFITRLCLYLFIVFNVTTNFLAGQTDGSGKLIAELGKADTATVNALNKLADQFKNSNPDTAVYIAEKAAALAKKLNYAMGTGQALVWQGASLSNLDRFDGAHKALAEAITIYDSLLILNKTNYRVEIAEQKAHALSYTGFNYYFQGKYPESLINFSTALKIFIKNNSDSNIAAIYSNIGIINNTQGNYRLALNNHFASLYYYFRMRQKSGVADSYNNIGIVYDYMGNYPFSLKAHLYALSIRESIGDSLGIADSYNSIGNVYLITEQYPEALINHQASLKIMSEMNDEPGMANSFGNIGIVYSSQGKYREALKNFSSCLKIRLKMGDLPGIADCYTNIGNVYYKQGNYSEALKSHSEALSIEKKIDVKQPLAATFNNIGNIYLKQKKYSDAAVSFKKGLSIGHDINSPDDLKDSHKGLSVTDSLRGDFAESLAHFQQYIFYRDKLFNQENTKKLVQSQMQYNFDKKESRAKSEQEKKDAIAKEELQRQKLVRNGFVGGFSVVLLFAGIFFTQRNKIKKGKKLSDELLLNILPSEVAEELKQKGSADAKLFDEVTVMFTDFKGFTQISEKLSPSELVAEIHTCFIAFDSIITKYGIEKIKTIGDSYMAAGGLPSSNKTHAMDVVNASLEIQEFMRNYNEEKELAGKLSFTVRIGIHTGPVVAGIVGIKKFAYDIWGDTVNTASRMESSGEIGKVNISGSTYDLVKGEFRCTHRGKVQAKNKGEIDMYFVNFKGSVVD